VPYAAKVVLHCLSGVPKGLPELVETFIADGVKYVGVVGPEASRIEDLIDEHVVGDGSDDSRTILTACHAGQTVEAALAFADSLTGEFAGETQVVEV
jgi:hypothetical protein